MRVLLDTNVLVRATKRSTGPALELLRTLQSEDHVLVLSPFVLVELQRVLAYPRVKQIHQLSDDECREFVRSLFEGAEIVDVRFSPTAGIASDPDDDPVIQTAIVGNVAVLCTLDRHLRDRRVCDYCKKHGVDVMTDIDLLHRLRELGKSSEPTA